MVIWFVNKLDIDYTIGDTLVSIDNPNIEVGICTGFRHDNTCVDIDGRCRGGKTYYMKSELVDCVVIKDK